MNSSTVIVVLTFISIVKPAFGLAFLGLMLAHFGLRLRQNRLNSSLQTIEPETR